VSFEPLVGRLGDGRVLVAGGWPQPPLGYETFPLDTAQPYDPVSNTWTGLPAMPEPRAGGAAVSLADGSVLLVGGVSGSEHSSACDPEEPAATGLASTVRFVPGW
jgi:hypothetical protein